MISPIVPRCHTLEETAEILFEAGLTDRRLSRSEIYKIEQRALRKIRRALASQLNSQSEKTT